MSERDWEYGDPLSWPRWARRAFLLTLPISGPLYIASFIAAVPLILLVGAPIMFIYIACQKIAEFWSAP